MDDRSRAVNAAVLALESLAQAAIALAESTHQVAESARLLAQSSLVTTQPWTPLAKSLSSDNRYEMSPSFAAALDALTPQTSCIQEIAENTRQLEARTAPFQRELLDHLLKLLRDTKAQLADRDEEEP